MAEKLTLQNIIKSRFGIGLALLLGRLVPPAAGKPLARAIGRQLSRHPESSVVRGLRTNHWVASGCTMTRQELDEDVTETLQTHAVCLYELYHNLNKLKFVHRRVILPQLIMERISENGPPQRGFVLCGLHISNFDLVMMSAGMMGVRGLGITVPSPGGGYRWQNEIRRRTGLELLPGSMDAVRTAVKHLQSGQVVGTGIDWPMPTSKYRPRFFGQPTNLQVMHVQLALMAKVPLAVMAATRRPDGVYQVYSSDLIELQPYPDRRTELVQNTEMLLSLSENIIRQNLRQWVMFYPLWPELQDETP